MSVALQIAPHTIALPSTEAIPDLSLRVCAVFAHRASPRADVSRRLERIAMMTEVHIPAGALVLIADGRKARFLRNKGNPRHVELILERELELENPPTREQGTDRPGRYLGPDRVSRSAVEQTDWHQQAEERFAADIADTLYHMAHAHAFDELVVVAAPKLLGALRAAFHPEVTARVVAELAKDLTSRPVIELPKLLS